MSCKFFLAGFLLETVRQRARLLSKTAGLALLVLKILQARWREGRERARERQDRARLVATGCRDNMAGAGTGAGAGAREGTRAGTGARAGAGSKGRGRDWGWGRGRDRGRGWD